MYCGIRTAGGHGGPPLHLWQGVLITLVVNVGVALRGHPIVYFKKTGDETIQAAFSYLLE